MVSHLVQYVRHIISYLLSNTHNHTQSHNMNLYKEHLSICSNIYQCIYSTAMGHQYNEEDVRQQDAQWKLALGKCVKQTATHSYIVLRMPRDLERGNQIVDIVRTGREKEGIQKCNHLPEEEELIWKMKRG
ncbi:unnamed protein product [Arctogadus glacialis]